MEAVDSQPPASDDSRLYCSLRLEVSMSAWDLFDRKAFPSPSTTSLKAQIVSPFRRARLVFFYYHIPRDLPPMAGGLRFRITAHENPASFEDGHDLLHDGLPWQISLHAITTAVGPRAVLREQLLHERLIMQADLDHCRAMMQKKQRLDPNYMLYRLAQPFVIHFHRKLHAWVVGETEVKPWAHDMFAEHRVQYTREHRSHSIWPYTGSALAQFELSTLPEHAGSDTVVMRIVKILARPTCVVPGYDGSIPTPVEGELVHHTTNRAPIPRLQPWSRKLTPDSSKFTAALRMLVENTRRWPVE
ncbi:hypothetical protein MSAN_01178400 [Mycena sanguinolenta]|uniref:Uncharacterized protein n=1 Tax=Mycena sanguinolenta TaxID=230812 RepID=A0A8H7D795_9AGAR|nr:hypothetical protein MSAN_01178400 [Mycena sanguinolenta]